MKKINFFVKRKFKIVFYIENKDCFLFQKCTIKFEMVDVWFTKTKNKT